MRYAILLLMMMAACSAPPTGEVAGMVTEEASFIIAQEHIKGLDSYEGGEITHIRTTPLDCDSCWMFTFSFETTEGSIIETHDVSVIVNQGKADEVIERSDRNEDGNLVEDGREFCESPRPDICPALFSPVCGEDQTTYGNSCEACANPDVNWYKPGECEI